MHRRQDTVTRSLAAVACAAALAACSGGGGGSTGNKSGAAPPQDVQSAVAASVASSVTSQITAMTTTGVDPFLALFNRVSTGRTPVVSLSRLMKLKRGTHGLQFGADCPTIAPSPIVDTDADGVPDSVSETYGNDCSESSDGSTLTVTGSVSVSDPTPTTPDLAYHSNLNNFLIQESGGSDAFSGAINGTLGVSETLSSITEAANYNYSFTETAPSSLSETVSENLTATFSFPATNTLLVEGDSLPTRGTFSIAGSETFGINSKDYAFIIATPTALTIDRSCFTSVTGGVVTVTFSGTGGTGTATITWTACGVYTITDA